jgi:hypothetical protein
MKRILYVLTLALGSILFTACPYSSEVALDERPNIPVSEKLMGKWETGSTSSYIHHVKAKDAYKYIIEKTSKDDGTTTMYEAFFSKVNDMEFLNIYEPGSTVNTYYFYRFTDLGNDRFRLEEVTDNIDETFTNAREMRTYFSEHMHVSFFFNRDAEEYQRVN